MRSSHEAVVADLEATKAEIGRTRAQSQVLIEEINELQQLKVGLARQMEALSSAFQQTKQEMETEDTALQARLSKLNRMISQMTAQQNSLRHALLRAHEERPALQSAVEMYTSTVSEGDGARGSLFPPPIAHTNEQAETAVIPPAQSPVLRDFSPPPAVTTPATPANQASANPKPQPAKQTSEPTDQGWLSTLKGWVVSIWRSIFP